jgi:hypothetical protein
MFAPLRAAGQRLTPAGWPSAHALAQLVGGGVVSGGGVPLRFVDAADDLGCDLSYERRICERGEVVCRRESWHDLFNALVWATFPRTKAALNARHVEEMARELPGRRGRARDALTLFDEGGLIVASADPGLLQLVREFEWKALFWERRAQLTQRMRFFAIGHALYEKALTPFAGITASAALLEVDDAFLAADLVNAIALTDARVAVLVASAERIRTPRDFAPIPVLGVPDWSPWTGDERFYDNADYFRRGRSEPSARTR